MSYARFGSDGSDVYVYASSRGIECCGCCLIPRHWVDDPASPIGGYLRKDDPTQTETYSSNAAAIAHMEAHRAAGHVVPEQVFERLRDPDDVAQNEAMWAL